MKTALVIARREFAGYFATPVATVFIVIFLVVQGALTFNAGNFFESGQDSLAPFFAFLPWVLLLLVPAIAMRLWAEERRLGTVELLLSLPVRDWQAVLGKFLAAWAFCAVAIILTFPFVITANILGSPDNGPILTGYIGALLIAGAFLAIGVTVSALTKNQVIAFVLGLAVCFVFAAASYPLVADFLGSNAPLAAAIVVHIGLLQRFEDFTRGIISLRDVIFFATFIAFWLFLNAVIVEGRKAA
jgi:ABC-2 type transport system permease protein